MSLVDWSGPAKLMERQDSGSDLYFEFTELRAGPLAKLVAEVVAMPATQRARMVIDAGPVGTLNVGDILALANRADYPKLSS
jgi:hypothetical protein